MYYAILSAEVQNMGLLYVLHVVRPNHVLGSYSYTRHDHIIMYLFSHVLC